MSESPSRHRKQAIRYALTWVVGCTIVATFSAMRGWPGPAIINAVSVILNSVNLIAMSEDRADV